MGARCNPAVDTTCVFNGNTTIPYMARCLCNGWWEEDQIFVFCDGGAD
jgi:hypothetical protein